MQNAHYLHYESTVIDSCRTLWIFSAKSTFKRWFNNETLEILFRHRFFKFADESVPTIKNDIELNDTTFVRYVHAHVSNHTDVHTRTCSITREYHDNLLAYEYLQQVFFNFSPITRPLFTFNIFSLQSMPQVKLITNHPQSASNIAQLLHVVKRSLKRNSTEIDYNSKNILGTCKNDRKGWRICIGDHYLCVKNDGTEYHINTLLPFRTRWANN